MEKLSIFGSMGGFAAGELGNASPRELEIDYRMGGAELDLRGDWVNDSQISIRTSQAGAALRLPRNAAIVGLEGHGAGARGDGEIPRPTLTFSMSTRQGELEIIE